jgi:uncharacterized membrane protein
MTQRQFRWAKIAVMVALAVISAEGFITKNYLWPIVAMVVALLGLMWLRSRVKEVMEDERDRENAGRAATLAIQLYSWMAVVVMFVLLMKQDSNSLYGPMAMVLAYSTCMLMVIYSAVFQYHNNIKFNIKKIISLVCFALIVAFLVLLTLRFLSGEDDWICANGKWVAHGHPDYPAPTTECVK